MLQPAMALVVLAIGFGPILGGCGTYVPDLPEPPSAPGGTQLLVDSIVTSIHCEIKRAVQYVIGKDIQLAQTINPARTAPWFDSWGVEGALTLTVSEKTEINPTVSWVPNPVSMLFKLAGGVDASSEAKRINTLNFYYSVRDLSVDKTPCGPSAPHPPGSFLIDSDLKIADWLESLILTVGSGSIKALTEKGVTHEVRFQVTTSGSITPSWKLSPRVSVNPSGTFFSTNRDRTHDLLLTFGPADDKNKTLLGSAKDQFFASQIGAAVSNRLNP
jgi:hypothetical protein